MIERAEKKVKEQRRFADIMIHIMFGAYTIMWVEACNEKIASIKTADLVGYLLSDHLYSHPRFYLGFLTFFSLSCLWWWYTNVLFNSDIFRAAGIWAWDLLSMAAFALCYNSWGRNYGVFGLILFVSLLSLTVRFKISLLIFEGWPAKTFLGRSVNWIIKKTSKITGLDTEIFDNPLKEGPEYKALKCGYRWLKGILVLLIVVLFAGWSNSQDGTLQAPFVQWTLVVLVGACIMATVVSFWELTAAQKYTVTA